MPVVRPDSPVAAILVSDIHLSLHPPLARAEEPSWLEAQARVLKQVKDLAEKHKAIVVCAGDIFDKWTQPHEMVNWALDHLPHMFSIPGNHDLPSHRPELVHRSAYGTLVRAGKITELGKYPINPPMSPLYLYGRPLNGRIPEVHKYLGFHVLVTHQYLWVQGRSYYGASQEHHLRGKIAKKFRAFDVVVVGDNHMSFDRKLKNGAHVINTGTLMRRKSSEIDYRPRVGFLHENGRVSNHYLDTSADVITKTVTPEQEHEHDTEVSQFIAELSRAESCGLDYRDNVRRALDERRATKAVRRVILEAMGE